LEDKTLSYYDLLWVYVTPSGTTNIIISSNALNETSSLWQSVKA